MVVSKSIRSFALALLAYAASFAPARAAWDASGNPISFAPNGVYAYSAIPFGDGGVLAAWPFRYYDPALGTDRAGIMAQGLDRDGNLIPGWGVSGPGIVNYQAIVRDGVDGAYVIWEGFPGADASLHIQRLAGGGVAPGWPPGGRDVAPLASNFPRVASDAAGGVYVAWTDGADGIGAFRLLRIGPDGEAAAGWPAAGLAIATPSRGSWLAIEPDGEGGVYLGWEGGSEAIIPPSTSWIMVRRFTAQGMPHPAWPAGGVAVGEESQSGWSAEWPQFVTDAAGGLYVSWQRQPYACPMMAQCPMCSCPDLETATHLAPNGAVVGGWTSAGIQFGNAGTVASDAAGGLLYGTVASLPNGQASGDTRGLATRVLSDGAPAPGWSPGGNPVCSEHRQQDIPILLGDGSGGAIAAWNDYRTFDGVPYVTRLTSNGSVAGGWPETGSILAEAAVGPSVLRLVPGRAGEAIVLWLDERSGKYQLYAQSAHPGPAGPPAPRLGLGFTVTDIRPNPARGAFWATASLPEPGIATLEMFDLAGRVLESHQLAGGKPWSVQMNASASLPAGVYWLRLRQGSMPSGVRTSVARVAVVR